MQRPNRDDRAVMDFAAAFNLERAVQRVVEQVRIRSYSGDEAEIADYMADQLSDLGLDVSRQEVAPRRFNVIGRWRGCGGGPSLMYNGHMDTNPAGEGWTRDPLAGERDDTFVYGIGVSNMKASNGAFLHGLDMLKSSGFVPAGDIVAAFVVGELQGGLGTVRMLESGIRTDFFIVGEPTELTLLTRHAASFVFEITLLGKTRHLSKAEEGIDAISKMERLLPRLRQLRFSRGPNAKDRTLDRIHVGVVRAGVSREFFDWRPQQLADVCLIKCAGRFGPGIDLATVMADIQALLRQMHEEDPDFIAELRLVEGNRIFMPPFAVDHKARPVSAVARAHRMVTGERARIGTYTPARLFGSDAAHLAAAGMTGVLYGAGGKYNTMPDERVAITEIGIAARVYAHAIRDLVGPQP